MSHVMGSRESVGHIESVLPWSGRRSLLGLLALTVCVLLSSVIAVAQTPGGGGTPGGGSGSGGSSSFFQSVSHLGDNRVQINYEGSGDEPDPAAFCEVLLNGVEVEKTYEDYNGNTILVGGDANGDPLNRSMVLQFPGEGVFELKVLVGWTVGGLGGDPDPIFETRMVSLLAGVASLGTQLAQLIGVTAIAQVQTDGPCDGSFSSFICRRFSQACPAGTCAIGVKQDALGLVSVANAMTVAGNPGVGSGVGSTGCSSCGSGTPIDAAIAGTFLTQATCNAGGVPPGSPGKHCSPSPVNTSGHVDLGLLVAEDFSAYPSSFGPGVMLGAYDSYIQRFTQTDQPEFIRIHDPGYRQVYSCIDEDDNEQTDGIFEDVDGRVRKVEYEGTDVRLTYHDGSSMLYRFYDLTESDGSLDNDGYVIQVRDAAERDVTIARDSNGNIQTISDTFGTTATFAYGALQSGRPSVSSITMTSDGANARVFTFDYLDGLLSEVKLNSIKIWSSEIVVNTVAQTAERQIYNGVTGIRHYNYTQAYVDIFGQVVAQPIGVIRNIEDSLGDNMMALFVNPQDSDDKYEITGETVLKHYLISQGPNGMATANMNYGINWTLGNIEDGWNAVVLNSEESTNATTKCVYLYEANADLGAEGPSYGNGSEMQDSHGMTVQLEYDDDGFILKKTYGSNDYEQWTRNINKQPLTYRDREGNVTTFTYDANWLTTSVSRGGATQAFTYSNKLLHEVRDPLYDPAYPTMHATTYAYTSGRPSQILGPAATNGATRPETLLTYTAWKQLDTRTIKRAVGNDYVEDLDYDTLGRVTEKANLTNGTNWEFSYIHSPGNPYTNDANYGWDNCPLNVAVLTKDPMNSVDRYLYKNFKLYQSVDNLGTNEDLFGGAATVNNSSVEYAATFQYYLAGTNTVYSKKPTGDAIFYTYDYRGRLVNTRRYTHSTAQGSQYLESTNTYGGDNHPLYSTDPYGRRTYYGYSTATGLLVRTIQEFVPGGISLGDNSSVLAATRDTSDNAKYAISDTTYNLIGELQEAIDPMGVITKQENDARGNRIRTYQAFGTTDQIQTEWDYNLGNQTVEVRNPRYFDSGDTNGYQQDKTSYAYDGAGRNISVTRAPGHALEATTQTVYHWDGRVDKTIDAMGNETIQKYGDCCDMSRGVKNALGHGTITNSDPLGRAYHSIVVGDIDTHTNYLNPDNAETYRESTVVYDGLGRASRQTTWRSGRAQIDYNDVPSAGLGGVSPTAGMTDQVLYDSNLIDQTGISSTVGVTVTVPLTGATFKVSLADALAKLADTPANGGAEVSFVNNNANGSATVSVNHDASSVMVQIMDSAGRTVLSGQMKGPSATNPSELLNWSCNSYDNVVNISGYGDVLETHSIDMDGNITRSRSDGGGRSMESEDVLGNIAKSVYKADGRLVKSYDRMNKLTTYAYNNLGQQTSTTNPVSATTSQAYDSAGNVVSQTDAKSNSATREFDVLGRLVSETDRTNATTTYAYNLNGQRTLQTDAESKATAWAYNGLGQRTSMTYSDAGVQSVTYNPASAVLTKTLPSGRVHAFTVDSFRGLVTQVDYKNPTGTITNSEAFTFDDMGRQTNVSSTQYSVSSGKTYDDYGRLDEESTTYSGQTYTVTYGYNNRGQRTSLTYPSGDIAEYGYDDRQLLGTISWESNQLEDRDYNANGLLTSVDRAFEDETRVYDDASRLTSISSTNTGSMTYTYDANNNVLSETLSGVMAPYSFTTEKAGAGSYADGYDAEDRFMRYIRTGVNEDVLLGRSGIGNISSSTLNGGSPTNRTYDNVHAMTGLGSANQTYDADGNATALHTGVTVDWDDAGRVEATHVGSSATAGIEGDNEYGYLDGKKVWRKITRSSSVVTHEVYVYDGPNRIADYDAFAASASPQRQRIHGDEIDSFAYLVENNGDILVPVRNRQWSVMALVDNATGTVQERYAYNTYGERTIYAADGTTVRSASSFSNYHGYTSREHLSESGLMFFRARHYDPAVGDFLSIDPLLFVDGLSIYRGYFAPGDLDPNGTDLEAVGEGEVDGSSTLSPTIYMDSRGRCFQFGFNPGGNGRWSRNVPCPASPVFPPTYPKLPLREQSTPKSQWQPVGIPSAWSPGVNINIWGEKEAEGYTDFAAADRHFEDYNWGRPSTATLGDRSVDQIAVRASPIMPETWSEMCRICKAGCVIHIVTSKTSLAVFRQQVYDGAFGERGYQISHTKEIAKDLYAFSIKLFAGVCKGEKHEEHQVDIKCD